MNRKYISAMAATAILALTGSVTAYSADSGGVSFASQAQQSQQTSTCTGTVTDDDGEPLPGATVRVDGTSLAASTNIDGQFSIKGVKPGAKIIITYVGYNPTTIEWKGGELNVVLSPNSNSLDEVVVVGYGTQKKVNLTGAVSQVKGDDISRRPVGDAAQMLQGVIPGLTVTNNNAGRPGGSATLQLRGQGNLSGSGTPYVLVDGIEMNLSEVNPSDIESVSVLKDAGASAIYGARAAYGVILVTTKRGQEGNMRISYNGNVGWNAPTKLPKQIDSVRFAEYWNNGCTNSGVSRFYSQEKIDLLRQFINDPTSVDPWFELSPNANLNPGFDNSELGVGNTMSFDLHYKDWAFKQSHNISASGGGKRAQYYVSLGYYGEDGILRYADMKYDRFNFASTISSQLTNWLRIRANSKFMHSDNRTPFGTGGLSEGFYHSLARFRPTSHYIDPNGHFTEQCMIPYLQSGTYTKTKLDRANLTFGMEVEPIKDWKINADYTYRFLTRRYEALNVAPDIYAADGVTTSKGVRDELGIQKDGKYTRESANTSYQNFSAHTNYSLTVADLNHFAIMAGYQAELSQYSYLSNYVTGLYSTTNPGLNIGSSNITAVDTRNSWSTRGFFGRINYDFDNRYLLEVNMRYDGTSRFSQKHRWGFFPSVSLGWNIAQEKFMESLQPTLNILKLRLSYGKLGNQSGAGLYTFASTMGVTAKGNYIFADGRHGYINAPGVIDPTVTWEKVESKNLGIDFGLFNNALSGTFEIFQRDTKDMLGPGYDFPDFFGASAPQTNNANMRNRGWELTVNWQGRITRDITYSIGGQIADATAKVTKYENPTFTNPSGNWYEGRMVGEIWGYKANGLLQSQAEADEYNKLDLKYLNGGVWTPGDVKYEDLNGDGKIDRGSNVLGDMGDQTIIGNTTPRYQYTINGMISWKGLALNLMFQGVGKRDWNPGTQPYFWGWGSYAQVTLFEEHLDYWSETNTDAYYPKPYLHTAGGIGTYQRRNMQTSSLYLQNAAYIRMKNITLSYDLPKAILGRIGLQKIQVYLSGENLLTWTKLAKMYDPEGVFTGASYGGEAGKNYPMNKTISIGLNVTL